MPNGFDVFLKVMDPALYENCLKYWIDKDPIGRTYREDIKIEQ